MEELNKNPNSLARLGAELETKQAEYAAALLENDAVVLKIESLYEDCVELRRQILQALKLTTET